MCHVPLVRSYRWYIRGMQNDNSRQLDTRRRISLATIPGTKPHDRYIIHIDAVGVITLTPATVVPDTPTTRAIDAFITDPSTGTHRSRPDRGEAA